MPYCHQCGAEVEPDQNTCSDCGANLQRETADQAGGTETSSQQRNESNADADQQQPNVNGRNRQSPTSQPQGGQPPQEPPAQNQPPQGHQQRQNQSVQGQPRAGHPPQGQRGQPGQPNNRAQNNQQQTPQPQQQYSGQPRQQGPRAAGGTTRRDVLSYGGGLAAVLGGGWLAFDLFVGGNDGPAGSVRSFVRALDEGDSERANEMLHSEASIGEVPQYIINTYESYDVNIDEIDVIEKTETQATVKVTMTASSQGASETETDTVELRTEDGEWKLYDEIV